MKFFIFEIRHWLRQPMTWVFFAINTLMIYGATSSDNIVVGGSFGNVHKNAPFVIQNYYAMMSIITLLMTTAFVTASTLRDFTNNTYQIIFSTPVKRMHYLLGRFAGSIVASVVPMLGISMGILIGCMMPWLDAERIGPIVLQAHINSVIFIAIPNTLFSGSVIFLIATVTRKTMTTFIGALVLIVITVIAGNLAGDLDKEWISILTDPYANSTFSILTKYWTVNDKNTAIIPMAGLFLANRLIFITLALLLTSLAALKFSFTEKRSSKKTKTEEEPDLISATSTAALPSVGISFGGTAVRKMFFTEVNREIKDIIKSPAFIVIMIAGILNFFPGILISDGAYGLTSHPVTWWMVNHVNGSFYIFLIAIITIYTGQLVWKEKDSKMDEIYDSTPHPTWISYVSKLTAVAGLVLFIQFVLIGLCVLAQSIRGFTDYRLDVYFTSLVLIDFSGFLLLIVLSMFLHTVINNKFIAFFAFVVFIILNGFIWGTMDIESNMVPYGARPSYIYSDMNGYGPFLQGIFWFRTYWYLFAFMLAAVTIMIWSRGKEFTLKSKLAGLKEGWRGPFRPALLTVLGVWILCGGFVFYNTKIINSFVTSDTQEEMQADYEKNYKKYQGIPQPRITHLYYNIDLHPGDRDAKIWAAVTAVNKSDRTIDSLHFTIPSDFDVGINLKHAKMVLEDDHLNYRIYRLDKPLKPGDTLNYSFAADFITEGFENEVSFRSVVDNGSFFNNFDFSPMIGYQESVELSQKDTRKDHDLEPKERMPKLSRNCTDRCMDTYLTNHADWVTVYTKFVTDDDQIAIAPGSLDSSRAHGPGRKAYYYKLDHRSLNFYSFISARYEVLREKHNGIDIEVYYDKRHPYNIDKMASSLRRSLNYFTKNFGPYHHKQARIIEFPRYATFAQAFPGTMPYSEGIGYIARIEDEEDIDMVFYVVAHEMAHQYWAHQVIGAAMQGATLLSESLAQYSALMVMEEEYGRDHMKRFLRYEMDRYLRARGTEELKELPLLEVENQGYIHYNKASLILYYLREMIGEENVNTALRELIGRYAYREPPYPTSHQLVDLLKEQTPDSLSYLITDMFETMTLFSNRVMEVNSKELPDGRYEVSLEYESKKFRADSLGKETEIPINDWIEFGVYADPGDRDALGQKLYANKHRITDTNGTITMVVDEKPFQAGIDPRNLMVDLVGDDNVKKISD